MNKVEQIALRRIQLEETARVSAENSVAAKSAKRALDSLEETIRWYAQQGENEAEILRLDPSLLGNGLLRTLHLISPRSFLKDPHYQELWDQLVLLRCEPFVRLGVSFSSGYDIYRVPLLCIRIPQ